MGREFISVSRTQVIADRGDLALIVPVNLDHQVVEHGPGAPGGRRESRDIEYRNVDWSGSLLKEVQPCHFLHILFETLLKCIFLFYSKSNLSMD